ncbi:hypothetical protein BU16DRAFT_615787 [Lophium mytilinum]|uniref:Uncharacterized protein n=1 Tax=Lophium mytilinum TaxID=390894 RepID=A0A6A6R362_9PEZI|nr:hypothetical protein BU16DRAFT_615787 [Lophium mytilinum]
MAMASGRAVFIPFSRWHHKPTPQRNSEDAQKERSRPGDLPDHTYSPQGNTADGSQMTTKRADGNTTSPSDEHKINVSPKRCSTAAP